MKIFTFIILLLLCKLSSFGQCDSSLIGNWKVISCFDGDVYFNLHNDSTFLSPEMIKTFPDTVLQKRFIQDRKELYGSVIYKYKKDGTFEFFGESYLQLSGRYCFIPSRQILQERSKNPSGKDATENIKVLLQNGLLFLSRKLDENKTLDLTLEKINE
jgi:hypothetical protein